MKYTLIIISVFGALHAIGQSNVDKTLSAIEKNNTTLAYLEEKVKSEQLEYKTGLNPDNPEIGLNHLWGSPGSIGKRTDFSISQSFEFPTVYSVRRQISDARVEQAKLQLEDYRIRLQLVARKLCYQLIYTNKQQTKLNSRKDHAIQLADVYTQMMDVGETNLIEFNKAALNKIIAEQAAIRNVSKREAILLKLQALNGGIEIELNELDYPLTKSFDDFETWVNEIALNHPHLKTLKQEVDILKQEEKLTRAMRLPKVNAGYMSENSKDERFQGLILGVSVPLWENKNRQKLARAQSKAGLKMVEDADLQFFHHIKNTFETSIKLKAISKQMNDGLEKYNNAELLKKAFSTGELSLISYLKELGFFYDTIDKSLEVEFDHMNATAELEVYSK